MHFSRDIHADYHNPERSTLPIRLAWAEPLPVRRMSVAPSARTACAPPQFIRRIPSSGPGKPSSEFHAGFQNQVGPEAAPTEVLEMNQPGERLRAATGH